MATIGIDASRANARERTGAEWYAYHLIQALKQIAIPGLQFVLYSREPLRDGLEELPSSWRHTLMPWKHLPLWTRCRLSWELFTHPVDLLFEPTHTIPLFRPRKVVITLHDIGFERHPELYPDSQLRYHRPMARRAVTSASRILTVSEFSRREIIEVYKVAPGRVSVTPNAIDPAVYHRSIPEAARQAILAKYHLVQPFLLYAGRLEAKKNIVNILRGFARFKSRGEAGDAVTLALVGRPGFGFDAIRAEITGAGLEPNLRMPGYVPEADLPVLLSAAHALVFPTRYEGFGIPIIQAQAVGTPVMTSDRAAMPETAGAGAILVDADDPDAIAGAMTILVDDRDRRAQLRAAGFENVKRYSWAETARVTMNIFLEVMGGGTRIAPSDRS